MTNFRHSSLLAGYFFLLLFSLATAGCDQPQATEADADAPATPDLIAPLAPEAPTSETVQPYVLKDNALMGMKIGEPLADFAAGLRAGVLRTGEGDFDVYYIDGAEGDELGYLMADEAGEKIVDITLTSDKVITEKGLAVGMTYADLQEKLSDFEVHGSEIEGYTHAVKDDYYYRLDAGNWSYEVDPATITPGTKIVSIGLPR